jgi:hypothetical protein
MVGHETQRFILVQGMVDAKHYTSGVAALVFVCSITEAIALSYEVDGICGRLDPVPKVPTLLYIGKRGRVTGWSIGLADCIPSLLHDMRRRLILAIVQIHLPWLALIPMLLITSALPSFLLDGS